MPITVYSSIIGEKDELSDEQCKGKADWVMFSDVPRVSDTWSIKKGYTRFKDNRRNSRVPKILSHQFIDTEYSIYIDGNISLLKPPESLVKRYLEDHDIALFRHNLRDCIYDEAMKCAKAGLDDPEVIIEQASTYEKKGYGKHKGLCECGVMLRRNTPKLREFENAWWSEYTRHSVRDQISFMYAVDSVGIRVNMIDMQWRLSPDGLSGLRGDFVKIVPHKIANPTVL